MDRISMIRDFTLAKGPSGFEDEVLEVARRYAPEGVEIREDRMRNMYFRFPETDADKPVVMLDAHSDEVGFMVQAVRPNGTLKFVPLGGWVNSNIPAHKVWVRSRSGRWIPGIVAAKPPHFMTAAEKNRMPEIDEMSIDIGAASPEEAVNGFGVGIGSPVVPDADFTYDEEHDLIFAKAMDNRLGCAMIQAVLHRLQGRTDLPVRVVGAMACQEEMGCRGAVVTANTVKPDMAIVFEGSPADDTVMEPWLSQTGVHRGPMLRHLDARMITHPRFQRLALDLAAEHGIPVQEAVRTGGSTNGSSIHLSGQGVPCIVIGLPVRYIHSAYGIASLRDFEHAEDLAVAVLESLTPERMAGM